MSTIVTSGQSFQVDYSSKSKFSSSPAQTASVGTSSVQETFVPSSQGPEVAQTYQQFDRQTQQSLRSTVKELAEEGRLFVREQDGLRRANPMEIKERLDHHQPVEVVDAIGSSSESSGSINSSSSFNERGVFGGTGTSKSSYASQSSHSEKITYTTSPISDWGSLEFADLDAKGVQGVAKLPASGSSVLVSSQFESNWQTKAHAEWGFWRNHEVDAQSSGFEKREFNA